MESRNVKVIDEHSIDRDAYVICGIKLDGLDYVLYSIERDGDNDNLFVSKIIKNMDGTSNMVNIEDTMEKSKVNEIVKELITYSIKDNADKTDGKITLADGKTVEIGNVMFNKEQNINVGKTYITTVKKSVTKVSEDFFKVEEPKKEDSPIFETVAPEIANTVKETPVEEVSTSVLTEPEVKVESPSVEVSSPEVLPVEEPVLPEALPVAEPTLEEPKISFAEEESNVVAPEVAMPALNEPTPVAPEPVAPVEPIIPVIPVSSPVAEVSAPVAKPVKEAPEVVAPPPVPVAPVVPPLMPVEEPVNTQIPNKPVSSPQLMFDGTQETNLNMALGEVSEDKTLPTHEEGVQSLREFGVDGPVAPAPTVENTQAPAETAPKVLTRSKGFANNKFFMVIAIAFFVAACVFLGYEVFKYFQLVK